MPKVEITNKKGLVQSPGGGDVVLKDAGIDLRGEAKVISGGGSIALKAASSEANTTAASVNVDFTDAIPADSIVVGLKLEVITAVTDADADPCTISQIGILTGPDTDAFATGLSLDAEAAGTVDIFGAGMADTGAGFKFYSAAETVRVTLASAADDTAGKLRLTVYYYQLA